MVLYPQLNMNKSYGLCLIFLALFSIFLITPQQTFGANCSLLYNGGLTKQQYCFNPTPTPKNAIENHNTTQTKNPPPEQTKGGQKIYPVTQSKTTPNTGPEEWSFPALVLIGGIGFLLRNKAKV